MSVHNIAERGKRAWLEYGQFTLPGFAPDAPDDRAALYIAGFLAGFATSEALALEALEKAPRWTQSRRGAE